MYSWNIDLHLMYQKGRRDGTSQGDGIKFVILELSQGFFHMPTWVYPRHSVFTF